MFPSHHSRIMILHGERFVVCRSSLYRALSSTTRAWEQVEKTGHSAKCNSPDQLNGTGTFNDSVHTEASELARFSRGSAFAVGGFQLFSNHVLIVVLWFKTHFCPPSVQAPRRKHQTISTPICPKQPTNIQQKVENHSFWLIEHSCQHAHPVPVECHLLT